MEKMVSVLLLFAYLVGAIGGCGYALYSRAWFVAVCVLILAVMALPTVIALVKGLTEDV